MDKGLGFGKLCVGSANWFCFSYISKKSIDVILENKNMRKPPKNDVLKIKQQKNVYRRILYLKKKVYFMKGSEKNLE